MAGKQDLNPPAVDRLILSAVGAQRRGDLAEAVELCRQVLAELPEQADALHLLAGMAAAAGQNAVAIDFWRQFVKTGCDAADQWREFSELLDTARDPATPHAGFVCDLVSASGLGADENCIFESVEGPRTIISTAVAAANLPQLATPAEYRSRAQFLLTAGDAIVTPNFLALIGGRKLVRTGLSLFTIRRDLTPAVLSVYPEIKAVSNEHALMSMPEPTQTVAEPAMLVSGGPVGPGSYYHWLIDYLTRLWALDHDDRFDRFRDVKFIVEENLSDFQRDSLAMLGIGEDRLIYKPDGEALHCEKLIAPSLSSETANVYPRAGEFIRRHFLDPAEVGREPGARIYISRRTATARRLINEGEVEALLAGLGFEIVVADRLTLKQQIDLFKIVAGPHGGVFANIAFAPVPCPVVEIVTKRDYSIFSLASALGHPHWHIRSEIIDGSEESAILDPDPLAYQVSLDGFEELISRVLETV